jgi:hypothetical protein
MAINYNYLLLYSNYDVVVTRYAKFMWNYITDQSPI